jgi:hypothetical protein
VLPLAVLWLVRVAALALEDHAMHVSVAPEITQRRS